MANQMNIKSAEAVQLARELAEIEDISLTDAVTRAQRDTVPQLKMSANVSHQ